MKRTTIMADEDALERLRLIAVERGVSLAEVIREALAEKAAQHRPKPRSLGAFSSGRANVRAKHDTGRMPPRSWRSF